MPATSLSFVPEHHEFIADAEDGYWSPIFIGATLPALRPFFGGGGRLSDGMQKEQQKILREGGIIRVVDGKADAQLTLNPARACK